MSQIAVTVENDVVDNYADENSAQLQATKEGWILVDRDLAFDASEKSKWTIRPKDGKLVHIDTNQTSTEEKNTVITQLTLQNLALTNNVSDLKKLVTSQALQALQDSKDKDEQRKVITDQVIQLLELQKDISELKEGTKTN